MVRFLGKLSLIHVDIYLSFLVGNSVGVGVGAPCLLVLFLEMLATQFPFGVIGGEWHWWGMTLTFSLRQGSHSDHSLQELILQSMGSGFSLSSTTCGPELREQNHQLHGMTRVCVQEIFPNQSDLFTIFLLSKSKDLSFLFLRFLKVYLRERVRDRA